MNTFQDRRDTQEKKLAQDEELRFKATARRNKMLGLWAAEKLGLGVAEVGDRVLLGQRLLLAAPARLVDAEIAAERSQRRLLFGRTLCDGRADAR